MLTLHSKRSHSCMLPVSYVPVNLGLACRQAQLQQGHDDYQSVAKREQREQERRRADQARDAERKTREEVGACQFTWH